MRTLILGVAAASLLASGIAFSLQATRAPSEPLEVTRKASETTAAPAPAAVAASEPTPIEFRQVRSVPVIEPAGGRPDAPAAAHVETPQTDHFEAEPAPQAGADQDRPADTSAVKVPETTTSTHTTVASLSPSQTDAAASAQERNEEASSIDRPSTKHTRRRLSAVAKPSRRGKPRAEIAAAQEPPAAPPAYDGSHENHSPFSSLRQLFGGAQ